MSAQDVQIPFVRGVQQAGDKGAYSEAGKLETAHNVHIRPEHADVLYRRPGFAARSLPDASNSFSQLSDADGRLIVQGSDRVFVEDDAGTFVSVAQYPAVGELSAELIPTVRSGIGVVQHVGYHERSDGSACQVWGYGPTPTDVTYYARTKAANGFWSDPFFIFQGTIANGCRIWCLPRTGGGWAFIYNTNGNIQFDVTASDTDNTRTAVLTGSTYLYDVTMEGSVARMLYRSGDGTLRVIAINLTSGASTPPSLIVNATAPRWACFAQKSDGSGYVYHGGYSAGSFTEIYAHQVNAAMTTATARGSVAQAFDSGTIVPVTAVCSALKTHADSGGFAVTGSWLYVAGNGMGRLFWTSENSSLSTTSTTAAYVGAIEPMGKIWSDSSFYGARVWGIQHEVMGCWQLRINSTGGLRDRVIRMAPAVYHSVTLGVPTLHDIAVTGQSRSYGIWQSGAACKAILYRPDASHTVLVSVGVLPTQGQVVAHAGFPVLLGGAPRYWDGEVAWPAGIPVAPAYELDPTAGAATFSAGVYTYAVVAEWHDARGRRQQSPVRIATYTAAMLSDEVAVQVTTRSLPFDERMCQLGVRLVVYRSDVDALILRRGETTAYSVTQADFFTDTIIIYTDINASDVFAGEPLYTAGGSSELASTALESTALARGLSDRFLTVHPNFPEQLVYTKTIKQGRGLEPNQALVFLFPQVITALAVQDGNVYVFSRDNIWSAGLPFADDTGQDGGAIDPIPLSAGIGCTQPLAVCETPVGVFFAGPRGFYLINRGGGPPQFVGYDIEKTFRLYPTVQGVSHNASTHEVAWACVDHTSEHRLIIYNYQAQQWFTWRLGTAADNPDVNVSGGLAKASTGFASASNTEVFTCSDALAVDNSGGTDGFIHTQLELRDFTTTTLGDFIRILACGILVRPATPNSRLAVSESHDSGTTWTTPLEFFFTDTEPLIYQNMTQKTRRMRLRLDTAGVRSPEAYIGVNLRVARQTGRVFTSRAKRLG